MSDAILNAVCVLFIITMSYFFKRMRLLDIDTARKMANVVMNFTLPCAILTSANGMNFDVSLLSIMLISFFINIAMLTFSYFSSRDVNVRMFNMLNTTCFNIGNFVLPFMQHTMSPKAFLALCMFDLVNALFCFGGSYAIALFFNRKYFPDQEINLKVILKEMSKSISFYAYLIVVSLSAMQLSIPDFLIQPMKTIGSANTLLCFMIIGIMLSFKISLEQFKHVIQAWAIRYTMCAVIAVLVWLFLPLDAEIRIMIMIILMAPMTSIAPIMTMKALPRKVEESADLNTIAIMSSLVFVTFMNTITPLLVD